MSRKNVQVLKKPLYLSGDMLHSPEKPVCEEQQV
jgi:hypothetical protein